MIVQLTEEMVPEFVKQGKIVIMGWGDGCGFCQRYAPIFEKVSTRPSMQGYRFGKIKISIQPSPEGNPVSAFKNAYMRRGDMVHESIPVTVVLENGRMIYQHFGLMDEEALVNFITTGEEPQPQGRQLRPDKPIEQMSVVELKAAAYDLIAQMEGIKQQLAGLNQLIAFKTQPGQ